MIGRSRRDRTVGGLGRSRDSGSTVPAQYVYAENVGLPQNSSYPETWPIGKMCRLAAQIVSSTWIGVPSVE